MHDASVDCVFVCVSRLPITAWPFHRKAKVLHKPDRLLTCYTLRFWYMFHADDEPSFVRGCEKAATLQVHSNFIAHFQR